MNNARPASCSRRGSAAGAWRERPPLPNGVWAGNAVAAYGSPSAVGEGVLGEVAGHMRTPSTHAHTQKVIMTKRNVSAPSIPPTIAPTGGEVLVTADVDGDNAFDVEVEKDVNEDKDADDEEEEEDDDDDDDEPAEGSGTSSKILSTSVEPL
uniref:Uncharacterized protein n=1 Tax=Psilocybe cubensis TaxID=181762 RepID=A0A8H7XS61_PSICU